MAIFFMHVTSNTAMINSDANALITNLDNEL